MKLLFTEITGAMLSSTVTVAVLEETFPFTSSTVSVTVFTPMFEQLNVVLSKAIVLIEQLSEEPLLMFAVVIVALPFASN